MSTFEFTAHHPEHGHVLARIEADNEREARKALRDTIFCRKLSAREIIELSRQGFGIIDAKTGRAIGAESCESGDPQCGPVTHHDSEGVPLCDVCYDGLVSDSVADPALDAAQP
jgi:hypothetical protein